MAATAAGDITSAAAVQQRPSEAQHVGRGGHEPAAGIGKRRRSGPTAVDVRVEQDEPRVPRRKARRQPAGRGDEGAVRHPQRIEEPRAQQLVERAPTGAGEHDTEHGVGQVVAPDGAGLLQQWEVGEARNPRIGSKRDGGIGRPDAKGRLRRHPQRRAVGLEHEAKAETHRQQVLDGHGVPGRHGVLEGPVEPTQHAPVGELGDEPLHRIRKGERPLPRERQRQRGHHRLRVRTDANQSVNGHRGVPARCGHARSVQRHLVAAQNAHNSARDLTSVDVRSDRFQQHVNLHAVILSGRPAAAEAVANDI